MVRDSSKPETGAEAVVEIFASTLEVVTAMGWHRAGEHLSARLRARRDLHSRERRFVGDAVHQMVRGLRRLRALCGVPSPTARQLYQVWLQDPGESEQESQELQGASASRIGEVLSYPDWLVEALLRDHDRPTTLHILRAQNQRAPLTVRVNLLKGTRQQLQERLRAEGIESSETPLSAWGLVLHTRVNVYGLPSFREGWMELQDEGSQLCAELVAPPPSSTVIDACAGAGGKTLALGGMMGNKGRLLALDIDEHKLIELRKRARRAGLTNVQALRVPSGGPGSAEIPAAVRGASRVLVDAPCSGLGVLRRNPEARWRLSPADLPELAAKQRDILYSAARLVSPHGRLIYATCTIVHGENDEVVDPFLRDHPDFAPVPIKEILGAQRALLMGDGHRLRLLPQGDAGPDGFFAAVLRRQVE